MGLLVLLCMLTPMLSGLICLAAWLYSRVSGNWSGMSVVVLWVSSIFLSSCHTNHYIVAGSLVHIIILVAWEAFRIIKQIFKN